MGRCANCEAAVSYFARICPRCGVSNQPNIVTTIGAIGTLVVLGAGAFLGARAYWSKPAPETPPHAGPATSEANPGEGEYGWLAQAMAECDVYAKQNAEILYFLIIPIAPTGHSAPGWQPTTIGEIGKSAVLVRASDALLGLRNGVFAIYRKPLTFAVRDPDTKTVYKWKPSVGVAELKSREIQAPSLALGLQLGDSNDVDWGSTLSVERGTCYWTNPLIAADR